MTGAGGGPRHQRDASIRLICRGYSLKITNTIAPSIPAKGCLNEGGPDSALFLESWLWSPWPWNLCLGRVPVWGVFPTFGGIPALRIPVFGISAF